MKTWGKYVAAAVVVLILVGTHWLAYHQGQKGEKEKFKGFVFDTNATVPPDMLQAHVAVLRMAVKHPSEFTKSDLFALKTRATMQLTNVEKISIPYAKRTGNIEQVERYEKIAASARELLTKLPD